MELMDKDLQSIQEVRYLIQKSKEAQAKLREMSQSQIDKITQAIAEAGYRNAEKLAKMAFQETGFGKWQDKVIKNTFAAKAVYNFMKDLKTVGIIGEDKANKIVDIAVPVGVIAALIPSTNPTSTVIYKALIAIKGGNTIVFSPHPNAKGCILETVRIVQEAAMTAGCPDGAIQCITIPTLQATNEMMKHKDTKLILATGGETMVRAAYSSGTPAIGVGPGNGPAFIDKTANVKMAVKCILDSKTFDNGTICASEQSIIVEKCMENAVVNELKAQGAYLLNEEESKKLGSFILRSNGTMNPAIVGRGVDHIAKLAGLTNVPSTARVLIARETKVGRDAPYSNEKLGPILAFYIEESVEAVLKRCKEILHYEGRGHTFCIHTEDEELVKKFACQIPASRIVINSPGALGALGGTTNLIPSLTLGCGAEGGSSTSNNVGPMDLINIKKVAYGVRDVEEMQREYSTSSISGNQISDETIEKLVRKIVEQLSFC